jgi:Flp pilus assembly protein TadD
MKVVNKPSRVQNDQHLPMAWNFLLTSIRPVSRLRLILFAAAFLVPILSVPMFAQQQVLLQAQSALDSNHPQQAIDILSKHVTDHPADDSAHLLLAEAFTMIGRAKQAEEQYQIILKHAPDHYIALAGLGELYASMGDEEKAERLLAKAVKYSRHEPQLRIEWAQALARLHRFKEASNALTSVGAPTDTKARIDFFCLKAAISSGLGNSSSAAAEMESALAIRPEDAGLQLATAVAELHAEHADRAMNLAQKLYTRTQQVEAGLLLLQTQLVMRVDVHPTLASLRSLELPTEREITFRQRLAEILISHGQFAESAVDLNRAAELDPTNPDLRFDLALAQFKAGETKDALSSAQKAKELRDSADVEALLGDLQETLGDSLSAIKNYQAAVSMDPKNEDHQLALALEFIRHRNFEPAKLVLEQAEKSFPKSWRIAVALGMVQYFVGTKQEASEILLRAVDLAPDPESVLRYLGDIELDESAAPDPPAMMRICEYADAHPKAAREQLYCGSLMLHNGYASDDKSRINDIIRRLTIAVEALPDEAAPHCELGRTYMWLENWTLAQRESEICARLNPDSAQAHYRLSRIYRRTEQIERAHEEIKLYKAASERLADENEQHENSLKTFIYTIRNEATRPK